MNLERIGLIIGWVALVAVVAATAWQTQQLVIANRAAIDAAQNSACTSAGLTYEVINIMVGDWKNQEQATKERVRAAALVKQYCGDRGQVVTP